LKFHALFVVLVAAACGHAAPSSPGNQPVASVVPAFNTLVFSKTEGFRHDSIPAGIAAIQQQGRRLGFVAEATEDAALFTDASLKKYSVIVFLSTTGDVLNGEQQLAFERFIRAGGGLVGVHSATDTEYDWAFYGALVGAYFAGHPDIQAASVQLEDPSHPTMIGLPRTWTRRDEWYNFQKNPRSNVNVLATLDERSYSGGSMGSDHPIIWSHQYSGGRAWYTAGGHTIESFSEPLFVDQLGKAIVWAANR
jgi:cytochrome c